MTREEFDNLLRLWGWAFGPRRQEKETGAGLYATSALASMGRPATIRQSVSMDRGGKERRRLLGVSAGLIDNDGRARAVPSWAVEPVRAAATRSTVARVLDADSDVPPDANRVEVAVLKLHRIDFDLATALRTQFCTLLGGQRDKADHLGLRLGVYRERLAEARGWVRRDLTT
ncbi:hypothetical protein [Xanthomonas citri]|uniref:hypothetical protein n=1 Tax=Xanthomonas citri TaxID=346 RepID=UPI0005B396B0|nr:hypothetical protein [Xanthomonas citri]AMV00066.1 hypothetical protein TP37_19795 [Xanthomonas citri pv. aurantifolii]AMV02107.1 hypothetical protein TP50_06340 [Xanthomonas citri pv. aurantifolii]MCC8492158.1 hypothetical protein [Xanthomonas citri pv. fuscans]TBW92957.1 hypothetical protein TP49_23670 [Xanthomonas citri pv. aurantifolii]TBX01139.1 hypothetical protein TP47_00870 [Xanthomonas citri pv. aurantifolii]